MWSLIRCLCQRPADLDLQYSKKQSSAEQGLYYNGLNKTYLCKVPNSGMTTYGDFIFTATWNV